MGGIISVKAAALKSVNKEATSTPRQIQLPQGPDFIAVRGLRLEAGVRQDRPASHRRHHILFLQRRDAESLRERGPQRQIRDARPHKAHIEDRPGIV